MSPRLTIQEKREIELMFAGGQCIYNIAMKMKRAEDTIVRTVVRAGLKQAPKRLIKPIITAPPVEELPPGGDDKFQAAMRDAVRAGHELAKEGIVKDSRPPNARQRFTTASQNSGCSSPAGLCADAGDRPQGY